MSAPDEKACPFCAEMIKVAAVKCRYCHSDLPAEAEPVRPAVAEVPLPPVTEPDEAPEPVPGPEPVRRGRDRITIGLAALCVALVAALVVLVVRAVPDDLHTAHGQVTKTSYRDAAMSAASANVSTLLSYDYSRIAEDQKKAAGVLTGAFADAYAKEMLAVVPVAVKEKRVRVATVRSASLVSIKADRAEVLVFADVVTTRNGVPEAAADYKRVFVTMTRDKGVWVISNTDDLLIN